MRLVYKLILTITFISCGQQGMKIKPIEDVYAKKNGEIPNENIFLIENFSNNIDGIITILNYTKDTIPKMIPFKKEAYNYDFVFNRNDVVFDDGGYDINAEKSISIFLNDDNTYFKSIYIFSNNNLKYRLKRKSTILIDYENFNLSVFKTFLDAVKQERNKIKYNYSANQFEIDNEKVETFERKYELIKTRGSTIECVINYIGKDYFSIDFPNHVIGTKSID